MFYIHSSTKLKTLPEIFIVPISRFVHGSDYIIKKLSMKMINFYYCSLIHALDAKIHTPEKINLSEFIGTGKSENETLLPEDDQG